ncbi:phage holin family protein [Rhodococcus triatomae]|uniref:Membrane protein n=1 Tax=Rhodococcus triatomae TaxID=300028 RepID=A0A1G8H2B5_9NOCA|nr:phage holin family protein [Rhodococcus triatomae]QNG20228.1 phage holin family protein [Rhodococcus triatomae]QNG23857.1 phage holin family protein [Rhodococcus triatomae]SDI00812.1 membrane protein [Rhodococcus triatomae]
MTEPTPDELSTVQLVERLQQQTTELVKTEIRDAVEEVRTKSTRVGIGVGISGAGTLLVFFGLATLVAAAVLGLANAVPAWLAALIVGGALLVVGGGVAAFGAQRAKSAVPPVPERTAQSVRKDVTTVKEHL